jgi:hypothetical protein
MEDGLSVQMMHVGDYYTGVNGIIQTSQKRKDYS